MQQMVRLKVVFAMLGRFFWHLFENVTNDPVRM